MDGDYVYRALILWDFTMYLGICINLNVKKLNTIKTL